jgi:hypothetical protein
VFFRHFDSAGPDTWRTAQARAGATEWSNTSPSGQAVVDFPTSSISILVILVGLAISSTSRPRTIAGGGLLDEERRLPVMSPPRRKTTGSVRRIESELCWDLRVTDMVVAGQGAGRGRPAEMAQKMDWMILSGNGKESQYERFWGDRNCRWHSPLY